MLAILAVAGIGSIAVGDGDFWKLGGGSIVTLAIVMSVVFRCWQGVAATALVVICSLAVALGASSVLGIATTLPLPIAFLTALGMQCAACVGLAHRDRVQLERRHARPLPRDARFLISEALRDVRGLVVMSAICAMIGVAALGRQAGHLVVGAAATGIAAMTIVPAVFAVFPVEPPARRRTVRQAILERCGRLAAAAPAPLLAIAGAAVVVGLFAVRHALSTAALAPFGIAAGLIWLVSMIALGSVTLGAVSLIGNAAPIALAFALVHAFGTPLDAGEVGIMTVALGLLSSDTLRCLGAWSAQRAADRARPASAMFADVGRPLVATPAVVALGFAGLWLTGSGARGATVMLVAAAATLAWRMLCTPAMLVVLGRRPAKPPLAEDASVIEGFRKQTAEESRTAFRDYSDAEIMNLNTADFLALAGKTVIRHGGSNGTRRMLVELDIQPHSRVLELGAGVGATAFDIAANEPTVHVTGIDLSAFMVEQARKRAQSWDDRDPRRQPGLGLGERVVFVHGRDPNTLPFDDNTFDIAIVESVAMYNNTDRFFREALRVLKPGGCLGLHDWCWVDAPTPELEATTCVVACGCNPGDVKFFTQLDWERSLVRQGFEIAFAEQYPFTFFSWSSMRDDEGTWRLLNMFGRVLSRRATARRMLRMMAFLARREGMFGYTVTIARKPVPASVASATGRPERPVTPIAGSRND